MSSELGIGGGVPFGFLCSLFRAISTIKPISTISSSSNTSRNASSYEPSSSSSSSYPALITFNRWFIQLQARYSPLPKGTTESVLRLMFPEEDGRRKYGLGERVLGRMLEEGCLGLGEGVLVRGDEGGCGCGCLGLDVERVLNEKCQSEMDCSSLTIAQVDELLNELSSTSTFTHSTLLFKYRRPHRRRSRIDILKSLYRPLSPSESKFITQIILKDLQPVLYPYPSRDDKNFNTTSITTTTSITDSKALLEFNTRSVRMLKVEDVMGVWDSTGWMGKLWRVRGEMEDVGREFEECVDGDESLRWKVLKPKLGSMIKLPKSVKGRNCHHALSYFKNSTTTVWAETKYDGERAQIHVEILEEEDGTMSSNIRIWSKGGRESTWDRVGVHGIVRDALGLGLNGNGRREREGGRLDFSTTTTRMRVKRNVVLDAEMVAWYKDHVDEFWRIRGLIEQTASGPRSRTKHQHDNSDSPGEDCDSQSSMMTDDSQSRHLALIFFDILVLDDEPLLFEPYATRRHQLESLIKVIPTKAMLSDRYPIQIQQYTSSSPVNINNDPHTILQKLFAERLADHAEGLVLKADEAQYNEWGLPWVKLKKDYIEGFGDCVDLDLVGAGWDRERARELRVTPDVFTTFFVGVITNLRDCQLQPDIKPHILVYFTVSYGLSRKDLEDLNFRIKNGDTVSYPPSIKDLNGLPFTLTLSPHLQNKPKTILRIPFLAELVFAGFDKSHGCKYYEPRFPRITKIHDKQERPWSKCMDISELGKIARTCVGKDGSAKEVEDWCKSVWGLPSSPTIGMKRQMRVDDILGKLVDVEGGLVEVEVESREVVRYEGNLKRRKLDQKMKKDERDGLVVIGLTLSGSEGLAVEGDKTITNGDRQILDTVLREDRTVEEVSLLNTSISCFINSRSNHQPCEDCSRWKKAVPKGRRVHSLEALLTACKVQQGSDGSGNGDIERGIVFVHVSDAIGIERTIGTVRDHAKEVKTRVSVFTCNIDKLLKKENALLVV